jgi:hypothetical protein
MKVDRVRFLSPDEFAGIKGSDLYSTMLRYKLMVPDSLPRQHLVNWLDANTSGLFYVEAYFSPHNVIYLETQADYDTTVAWLTSQP